MIVSEEIAVSSKVDQLIELPPFEYSEPMKHMFKEAIKEAWGIHFRGSKGFANYMSSCGFDSEDLHDDFTLESLPFIHVDVFRNRPMITGAEDNVVLELTSSGTGGKKSRNFLDQCSLDRIKKIARTVYDGLDMVDDTAEVNYVCFSYDPVKANDLGTAFTDDLLTSFTKVKSVFYAIQWSEEKQDFFFDAEQTLKKLEAFGKEENPVRLLGFPAFVHKLLNMRKERGLSPVNYGPKSWAMTGGGWKTFEDESIPRDEFAALVEEDFGVPAQNVRDLFGMVEHGVPYVQCEKGAFHIPIYSYPIIREPLTLRAVEDGEPGLLQLITPYWTSYPALSILTGDVATIGPACSCRRGGKTLQLLGRGGITKHKGCAIKAAELLGAR